MFSRLTASRVLVRPGLNSINEVCNNLQSVRFATKKAGGSVKNGRDTIGKRLGVKKFGGEHVIPGNIIIRQRGQKYHYGENTFMGRDHTIHAKIEGYVKFTYNKIRKYQVVSVIVENPNIPRMIRTSEVVQESVAM